MKFYKHLTIIGVDHGYGNIKTANHVFKSGVIKCDEKPYFDKNLLTYNGEYYLIGEGHKEFIADKFTDFDYYVLTLAAIATELRQRGTTQAVVHIAAGLPLTWIGQQMESFKEYLLQNKTIDFKFKGVDYHITIAGVDIFPQGYSAIASRVSEFSGMNMLADIGNGTMNIMNINNGNPDIQNCFTEKFGTHQCTLKIKENMMKKHHANIDENIITDFLCTGTADVLEDYLVTMRETAKKYVSEIFRRLREHNYNPNLMKLHIVGGGGCLVKNFTDFDKKRVYINDDICATAKGYEYLAGTTTLSVLERVVKTYIDGIIRIEEKPSEYTINIKFVTRKGVPGNLSNIEKEISEIIPAHIYVKYVFTYRSWNDVAELIGTWNDVAQYTWDGLATKEVLECLYIDPETSRVYYRATNDGNAILIYKSGKPYARPYVETE